MTIAAAIEKRTAEAKAWSTASSISGIDVYNALGPAERVWRSLEQQPHLFTPYQRFDFLEPWQRSVGEPKGVLPYIVIAYDVDRRPLLVLPLALSRKHGVRIASFMGGKHATYNMALWNRDFAAGATAADIHTLVSAIAARSTVDVLAFKQQPLHWRDLLNPMALLPNQASANTCPSLTIMPGATSATLINGSLRRQLNRKERKLQSLAGYRYSLAAGEEQIKRLLDWFFCIKPLRMAARKLPNVFAEPGVEDFIRSACMTKLAGGGHVIDLHALECDDEVIAIFAGVADGHRFSTMFNTYTVSGSSRHSPGLILMRKIIEHYAGCGYRALDLGIGSDDYKRLFCKSSEPIFDSFIPLTVRGNIAAAGMSAMVTAKRLVKHNHTLFHLARTIRSVVRS